MLNPPKYYTLKRCLASFTRYGIEATLFNADGTIAMRRVRIIDNSRNAWSICDKAQLRFYGNDGRKVRSDAIAWCKAHGARRQ